MPKKTLTVGSEKMSETAALEMLKSKIRHGPDRELVVSDNSISEAVYNMIAEVVQKASGTKETEEAHTLLSHYCTSDLSADHWFWRNCVTTIMQKMRGNCPDEALERFDAVRNAYEAKTPILPSPPMYGTRTKPVPLKKGVATSEILQALDTLAKDDGNGLATLVKLIWKRSSYDQKYRPDMTAIDELVTGIIGLY